jgi:hypothetical protein
MSRQMWPAAIAFFLSIKIPPCVINMQYKLQFNYNLNQP